MLSVRLQICYPYDLLLKISRHPHHCMEIQFHKNFRVPEQSVIYKIFTESLAEGVASEDLAWWESSDGTRLEDRQVNVLARRAGDTVYALVIPQ